MHVCTLLDGVAIYFYSSRFTILLGIPTEYGLENLKKKTLRGRSEPCVVFPLVSMLIFLKCEIWSCSRKGGVRQQNVYYFRVSVRCGYAGKNIEFILLLTDGFDATQTEM